MRVPMALLATLLAACNSGSVSDTPPDAPRGAPDGGPRDDTEGGTAGDAAPADLDPNGIAQWRAAEIDLLSTGSYGNPWLDVSVTVEFSHADGTTIRRPAFWYDGNVWKVRFAPTKVGTWSYVTQASVTADTGLHGVQGTLTCVPYQGSLPLYRHGFLAVSADGRHLVHRDGTRFFYLGDTHWFMESEPFQSRFVPMVDKRVAQGFTVYQSHPMAGALTKGDWVNGPHEIDPEEYKALDKYFAYIAEQGLVHAFGIAAHSAIVYNLTVAGAEQLARYLCARYGAYPVIFFTSQEVDLPITGHDLQAEWKHAFDAWNACDDYDHPATCHTHPSTDYDGGKLKPRFTWASDPEHDLFFHQLGHTGSPPPLQLLQTYRSYAPPKPFIEVEANYEEIGIATVPDSDVVRRTAYKAIQGGSAGFGYGASGLWNNCTTDTSCSCCVDVWGGAPWQEAVDFPGARQLGLLGRFYSSLEWWRIVPRFHDPAWSSWQAPESSVLGTIDSELFVAYLYGANAQGTLRKLTPGGAYAALWFDPRHGWGFSIGDVVAPASGEWQVPARPDGQDWLLVLVKKGAKPDLHKITASAGSGGRIFPQGNVAVFAGDDLELSVVPRTGHTISGVQVDGKPVGTPPGHTFNKVSGPHTIQAAFGGNSPSGLIAEWKLEGGLYGPALDHFGDHHATPSAGVAFVGPCKAGQCASLDGTKDQLRVPDAPALRGMSALSISLWLKLDALPPASSSFVPLGKENAYRIVVDPGGAAHVAVATTANGWYSAGTVVSFGASALGPGQWRHLVATYDGSRLRTYLDGQPAGTGAPISGPIASATGALLFGAAPASNTVETKGEIDEIRLYNAALSASQVQQLHATY
jgi:hypothetical protein